ncbi:hypothetical protein CONPUDRAFT_77561 [Coniophora puteana RWD-64-598 SS2]|uniref:Uncharacterized protein n=1 Tax=Coniophora puteana (strain RWD-64-598) TaxID=741705 RepID=A0A5M3M9M5_CONPW|nr:uncharacterized protein CONPUDRAFT_77561 [Coniophora puteana RWD-64-598 SS2]EIW75361.1 hypothetical protein CONPUDRAFT_77561 [Coniophora puteana RWD-64-598 SS2]
MIRNHKFTKYILETKGKPVPAHYLNPDAPQPDIRETTPTTGIPHLMELKAKVENDIAELRAEHQADLSVLMALTAEAYRAERHDRLSSIDMESAYWKSRGNSDDPHDADALAALHTQHTYDVVMAEFENDADDTLHWLKDTHFQALSPLLHQLRSLKSLIDAQYPSSPEDFNKVDVDLKLRVARHIVASPADKLRMMETFGWRWDQCIPLCFPCWWCNTFGLIGLPTDELFKRNSPSVQGGKPSQDLREWSTTIANRDLQDAR